MNRIGGSLLLMLLLALLLFAPGCISVATWEQESDWRWKQWDPNYRPIGAQAPNPP